MHLQQLDYEQAGLRCVSDLSSHLRHLHRYVFSSLFPLSPLTPTLPPPRLRYLRLIHPWSSRRVRRLIRYCASGNYTICGGLWNRTKFVLLSLSSSLRLLTLLSPVLLAPMQELPSWGRTPVYIWSLLVFFSLQFACIFGNPGIGGVLVVRFLAGFCGGPALATGGSSNAGASLFFRLFLPSPLR
jgi:hypothetical protein